MKILTLTTDYYGFGGMEATTREIDSELRIRGIDSLVISILDRRTDSYECDTAFVKTLGETDRGCYMNPLTTLRLVQLVVNELKSRDILHINSKFPTLPLVALCARLMNKKVVYTNHGRPSEQSRYMETLYNITTRLTSFVSNISLGISRFTTEQLGRKGQNLGYFADVNFFSQEVSSFKFDWPNRYIFYPARFCYGKNQAALLTVASDLSHEGISIVLMGQIDDRIIIMD